MENELEAFRYGLNNVVVPQLTEEENNANEKLSVSTLQQQDAENNTTNNGDDNNIANDDDEDPSRVARRQKWQEKKANEDEKLKGGNNNNADSSMLVCPSTVNLNTTGNDISMSSEYNNINEEEAEEEATNIDIDEECNNNVWNKVDENVTGFNPPTSFLGE